VEAGHDTHILVVEDDEDSRNALCETLIDAGYMPFAVADGVEALEHLRTGARPNLIVLDLMLPRIDGWRFLTIVADEPDLSGIPVVVCTGAAGASPPGVPKDHILTKPINIDALMGFVSRYCGPGLAFSPPPSTGRPRRTPTKRRRTVSPK
jgi:twitching motility two-component system response regulator PilG